MSDILKDAVKSPLSMKGFALLQWGFEGSQFPRYSVQLPEDVIDQILEWRNLDSSLDIMIDALHQISLASQNSMSSQRECGQIARTALEKITD